MPTWRMTIPKTATLVSLSEAGYLIQGTGSPPVAQILMPPPDPTPISTTPPPEPDEDHSAFAWPPQPGSRPYRPEERYAELGEGLYAGASTFQNPLPGSHWYAGRIERGRVGGWDLAGYDLWAPRDAKPEVIRKALATGTV